MVLSKTYGLGLVELLAVVAIVAVLLGAAQPLWGDMLDRRRVIGAADAVRAQLQHARSEAIKQSTPMVVTYSAGAGGTWRTGTRDGADCDTSLTDPQQAGACSIPLGGERVLVVRRGDEFGAVAMTASRDATRFNPVRGTALGTNATVRLVSPRGREIRIVIANIGRVRTCSPSGEAKVPGQPDC